MAMMSTIAEVAVEVVRETGNEGVCLGDSGLLDMIARRAGMKSVHPLERHKRVLDALGKRPDLFDKHFFTMYGRRARSFWLHKDA